jgi:dihydrofolate reductase
VERSDERETLIGLIAAVAHNGVIGRGGALPWRLPDDMKQFRARTIDHAVIMGRKTWESLSGPLARRTNIVITRREAYEAPGAIVVHDLETAIARAGEGAGESVWVIGGAEIYAAALPRADRLVITHVEADVDGDAHFPPVNWADFAITSEERHEIDERHAHAYRVVVYERRRA